jgi:hypothetical protein
VTTKYSKTVIIIAKILQQIFATVVALVVGVGFERVCDP